MIKNWMPKMNGMANTILKAYCQLTGRPLIEADLDYGFGNFLAIRGELPGLDWQKGTPMFNLGPNSWFWIVPTTAQGSFKVLINDCIYEEGANHKLVRSHGMRITPTFNFQED